MAGRHLRRRLGPDPRRVALALAVVLAGLVVGALGVLATEDPPTDEVVVADAAVEADAGSTALAVPGTTAPGTATLAFVGDVVAQYGRLDPLLAAAGADGPDTALADWIGPFADLLRRADLAMANVEAAIAEGGTALDKSFSFRVPPTLLDALAQGGIDVASVANNHGLDYGVDGLAETLAAKEAYADRGIAVLGVGADEDEAYAPAIRTLQGVRVGVLAATQVIEADVLDEWTATDDQPGLASAKRVDRLVEAVADLRDDVDVVVVFLHWGIETEECPSDSQTELAGALVDAGADVVVGTHAHRLQGGGRLGDAVVHYGLGNFAFGSVSDASARSGVLLVEVGVDGPLGYEWVPGRVVDAVPVPLEGDEAAAELAAWEAQRDCTDLTP